MPSPPISARVDAHFLHFDAERFISAESQQLRKPAGIHLQRHADRQPTKAGAELIHIYRGTGTAHRADLLREVRPHRHRHHRREAAGLCHRGNGPRAESFVLVRGSFGHWRRDRRSCPCQGRPDRAWRRQDQLRDLHRDVRRSRTYGPGPPGAASPDLPPRSWRTASRPGLRLYCAAREPISSEYTVFTAAFDIRVAPAAWLVLAITSSSVCITHKSSCVTQIRNDEGRCGKFSSSRMTALVEPLADVIVVFWDAACARRSLVRAGAHEIAAARAAGFACFHRASR